MAHWMDMIVDRFKRQSRVGEAQTRVSWSARLIYLLQFVFASFVGQAVMESLQGKLSHEQVVSFTAATSLALLVSLSLFTAIVRRDSDERYGVAIWMRCIAISAAVVLLICLPKL